MAKIIKITPECKEQLRKEFEVAMDTAKLSDGKLNYTKNFTNITREAVVYFTDLAWEKMQALIKSTDKEIGWHGLAYRGGESTDDYYITDILVYPQEVTSATVNTDQSKYEMWLMKQEDEVFNNVRMHGHSHVNMGVSPSSVDTSMYERFLSGLDDTMFYIFLIYNKKGDKMIKIYDLAKNILFETTDVKVKVLEASTDIVSINIDGLSEEENTALSEYLMEFRMKKKMDAFVQEAKEMVTEKTYSYSNKFGQNSGYNSPYGYGYGYGYGQGYNGHASYRPPLPEPAKANESKGESKKPETKPSGEVTPFPSSGDKSGKSGKRKGKKKGKKGKGSFKDEFRRLYMGNAHEGLDDDCFGDNDYDDNGPYSPFGYSRDGFAH